MQDEPTNLFDAVRKANRMVWEQAKGGGFDSSSFSDKRKENASAWDRASGKAGSESKNIPPPTGRESPLEGADASAMVAALSAKLSALQARVDYIEDDFPEVEGTDSGTGVQFFNHSMSLISVSGSLVTCSGGEWYHRTSQYGFEGQEFWLGGEEGKLEEYIAIPEGTVYVYVELPTQTWNYTTNADDIKSGTTYLRRCIFSAVIADGRATNIIVRNAGDIHS